MVVIVIIMSNFRLGFLIDFISQPVIAGFTSGAALTIASGQIKVNNITINLFIFIFNFFIITTAIISIALAIASGQIKVKNINFFIFTLNLFIFTFNFFIINIAIINIALTIASGQIKVCSPPSCSLSPLMLIFSILNEV